MRKLMMLIVLVIGSLPLVACGAGRLEIVRERGSDVFNATLSLNEDDMAALVAEAQSRRDPFIENPTVDLQAGQIEITGMFSPGAGRGPVNGSIVVVPSVDDGVLIIEVVEVDIQGVDVSEERIQQFNDNLAERIARWIENRRRELTMTGVSVTDDLMVLTFDAERLGADGP